MPATCRAMHGLSPLAAGLWVVPTALAMVAGCLLAPALAARLHPEFVPYPAPLRSEVVGLREALSVGPAFRMSSHSDGYGDAPNNGEN